MLEASASASPVAAPRAAMADRAAAVSPGAAFLWWLPQPFYEDRGTPIAVRQVLQALGELGRSVDLLTFPIGTDISVPGLSIFRSANPFGFRRVPIGLSLRKVILDVPLAWSLRQVVDPARYSCIHAVEEAAFPAAVLARRHGIPLLYDMQSSLRRAIGLARPPEPGADPSCPGCDGAVAAAALERGGHERRARRPGQGNGARSAGARMALPERSDGLDAGRASRAFARSWGSRAPARSCSTAGPSSRTRGCPS